MFSLWSWLVPESDFNASKWSDQSRWLRGWKKPVCFIFLREKMDLLSPSGCFIRFKSSFDGMTEHMGAHIDSGHNASLFIAQDKRRLLVRAMQGVEPGGGVTARWACRGRRCMARWVRLAWFLIRAPRRLANLNNLWALG